MPNPMGPDLLSLVRRADAEHHLFPRGSTVLAGVSGGADSVVMLHVLRGYASERDLKLHSAHLDHMLRPTSVEDAAFVARLAKAWDVPCHMGARDVRGLAARLGRGQEDAARMARYAFLRETAVVVGADVIAMGHTMDDQAETVLLHLVRGAGLAGLRGMRPRTPFPLAPVELERVADHAEDRIAASAGDRPEARRLPDIVRPLLGIRRAEVGAYRDARELETRVDETNASPRFLRNRVRHEVLPLLEDLNPRVVEALARFATAADEDLAAVEAEADAAWSEMATVRDVLVELPFAEWAALPPGLQRRLLRRSYARLEPGGDLEWSHVDGVRSDLLRASSPSLTLPRDVVVARDGDRIVLRRSTPRIPPPLAFHAPLPVAIPGVTNLPGGWSIEAGFANAPGAAPRAGSAWEAVLDASAVGDALHVRGRRPGDRMRPLGMGGRHKSLQDLFVDAGVPRAERDSWPVVVSGDEIVWVPGLRLSEPARIREGTTRVVRLSVRPPGRVSP